LDKKFISNTDIEIELARNAFLKFWGSLGYSKYDDLVKNNSKKISEEKLLNCIIKLKNSKERGCEVDTVSEEMAHNLNERIFDEVMEFSSSENAISNIVVLKAISGAIDSIEKIAPNRWMSFTMNPEFNYETVINEPESFVQHDSYFDMCDSDLGISYIVISLPLGFKYVNTRGLCDKNEILINSNEILKLQEQLNFHIININYDTKSSDDSVGATGSKNVIISNIVRFIKNFFD
jgi:hypothetical protein